MKFEQLTDRDMHVLVRKVEDIAKMLLSIHEIIESEKKDPSDPDDNVIQLVPMLLNEYEINKKISIMLSISLLYMRNGLKSYIRRL